MMPRSTPINHGATTNDLKAIMNGSSTIGRLGSAYICKYASPLHVHCAVTLVSSFLCFFLWTFATTLPAAVAFVVIFGAFSGSVIGLPPASMAAILHNDNARLGQWTGRLNETHMDQIPVSYTHLTLPTKRIV